MNDLRNGTLYCTTVADNCAGIACGECVFYGFKRMAFVAFNNISLDALVHVGHITKEERLELLLDKGV